jgi:Zinc knuckle
MALRERFENINTMGLTELTSRFYEVVKNKGHECPDEWFSDMLYLNDLLAKANGTKRTDAEILAHIINVAPRGYNITLSIISQNNINAKDALSRAQIELRNYWKRNLEEKQAKFKERNHNKSDSAYAFSGGKFKNNQGKNMSTGRGNGRRVGNKSWRKFKGHYKLCGMQGHKSTECQNRKQSVNQASSGNTLGAKNFTGNCYKCGKPGHISKNCRAKSGNQTASNNGLFVGLIEDCIISLMEVRAHKDWSLQSD